MKRVDALRSLMGSGIQRVDLMADFDGEPINIDAGMAIKLYNYLDEDLYDPKEDPQKPKDEQQKPKAVAPIPKKVVAGSEKRKKLDDGKMLALRRAGWTYKKISDEMHCSEQTVINHIKDKEGKA